MFIITKKFTDGLLKGLTITEETSVSFILGKRYKSITGTHYIIVDIIPC